MTDERGADTDLDIVGMGADREHSMLSPASAVERSVDSADEHVDGEWFQQVVVCAVAKGDNGVVKRCECGHQHDGQAGMELSSLR